MELEQAIALVRKEAERAREKYPAFRSHHEGYAIVLEELDELKAEVFKRPPEQDLIRIIREATHVSAMGLRYLIDLC